MRCGFSPKHFSKQSVSRVRKSLVRGQICELYARSLIKLGLLGVRVARHGDLSFCEDSPRFVGTASEVGERSGSCGFRISFAFQFECTKFGFWPGTLERESYVKLRSAFLFDAVTSSHKVRNLKSPLHGFLIVEIVARIQKLECENKVCLIGVIRLEICRWD